MFAKLLIRVCLMALAYLTLSAPSRVSAEETAGEYGKAIQLAVVEFDSGNWREARILFRRAHEIEPNARTWRGLGITAFELRSYVEAIAELEAALADPRKPLTEQQRKEVQALLVRAREFVSVYRVTVTPENAQVLVDGKPATLQEGRLFLDPGQHSVVVRAAGYEERRADLKVDGGEQDQLSIELAVAESVAPEAAQSRQPATDTTAGVSVAPRRKLLWTWVLGGAALAVGGTAVGLSLAAKSNSDDFQDACQGATYPARCHGLKRQGERQELLGWVGYGLSGALASGAITAFFLEGRPEKRASTRTSWRVGPSSIAVRGTF